MPKPLSPEDCADLKKWFSTPPPPMRFLLKDLIPAGLCGYILAAGGIGKSHIVQLMAIAMACGKRIGPFDPERPCRVFVVNVEDPADEIQRRLYALQQEYRLSEEDMDLCCHNLFLYPGRGKLGPLMGLDENRRKTPTENLLWLADSIRTLAPDLVVLDTKIRLYGLDENSNTDNNLWLAQLERICAETGAGFLIAHHTGKGEDKRRNINAAGSRGGSSQVDDTRFSIYLAEMEAADFRIWDFGGQKPVFKMALAKANYCDTENSLAFFRRGRRGVPILVPARPKKEKARTGEILVQWLTENPGMRERDLLRGTSDGVMELRMRLGGQGKPAPQALVKDALEACIRSGLVRAVETGEGQGRKAKVLEVVV